MVSTNTLAGYNEIWDTHMSLEQYRRHKIDKPSGCEKLLTFNFPGRLMNIAKVLEVPNEQESTVKELG